MAGHAQLKFVMTECSKTQIRLTGLMYIMYIGLFVLPGAVNRIAEFCNKNSSIVEQWLLDDSSDNGSD